jgi:hypothetical protein
VRLFMYIDFGWLNDNLARGLNYLVSVFIEG